MAHLSLTLITLELVLGIGCIALSWAQVRRVEGTLPSQIRALATSLRKLPEGERTGELARRTRPGSWEHRLATELLEAQGEVARVAALNDALADADQTLTAGQRWPASAARIAAWGSMLVAVTAFLFSMTGAPILAIAGIGGASMIACLGAGRRATRAAKDRRETADALVSALVGPPKRPSPGGALEGRGWQRARTHRSRGKRGPGPS